MLYQLCLKSSPKSRRCGLVAAVLWLTWVGSMFGVSNGAIPLSVPCPDENDILPCVCTVQEDFTMDMNCSAVRDSNELALVFSKNFPFLDFNNLYIIGNTGIRTLRFGDLGHATFQRISITDGKLESVVHGALMNSYDTLDTLDLSRNHVTDFPFDEISSFKKIDKLYFWFNALNEFPHIYSSTLRHLQIGQNPLRKLSPSALENLPNLETIGLHSSELSSVEPGTFTGLPKLNVVHLEGNRLTTLRANTIKVTGATNYVHLNSNNLVSIEASAILGASYEVWINDNELVELNEAVWRQMFDANIRLSARSNPFTCGCEIAWIVLNVYYLENLMDQPTCKNGEFIADLDPAVFNELCT